ncbi:peptidase C15, pyroglutamyl peptidase I-like protein [Lentithecium fluviatile CBS 122367]|uniref:Peptidase C15, pyroglutamyl peptidase I-like protein n=1 Tax=Lentithecium fluviatile CBS 122367 TaxID=1168545 RepID=A0A6G1J6K3_9PLEO|nr:peptidase C15, pyroglutamyl peptidase I-like protein [Lentithecium fluviatile CBS 122367]
MPRDARAATARQPPPQKGEEPVTVLVTGFGPFLAKYPRNSSWEIASTLPALIPATEDHPTPIHIHVNHEAVRVAYNHVIKFIPQRLPPANPMYPRPDIVLHIGLAAGRPYYTLEKGAHGRGYGAIPDVDGERFPDEVGDEKFPPELFPYVLHTSFDTSDVVARWRSCLGHASPDCQLPPDAQVRSTSAPDVRLSPDAGNFLCGFIYYNSLAHYYSMKEDERPVAFLHVPDLSDSDEKLNTGRNVAIALIKALVESKRSVGVVRTQVVNEREKAVQSEEKKVVKAETDINFV